MSRYDDTYGFGIELVTDKELEPEDSDGLIQDYSRSYAMSNYTDEEGNFVRVFPGWGSGIGAGDCVLGLMKLMKDEEREERQWILGLNIDPPMIEPSAMSRRSKRRR